MLYGKAAAGIAIGIMIIRVDVGHWVVIFDSIGYLTECVYNVILWQKYNVDI